MEKEIKYCEKCKKETEHELYDITDEDGDDGYGCICTVCGEQTGTYIINK